MRLQSHRTFSAPLSLGGGAGPQDLGAGVGEGAEGGGEKAGAAFAHTQGEPDKGRPEVFAAEDPKLENAELRASGDG